MWCLGVLRDRYQLNGSRNRGESIGMPGGGRFLRNSDQEVLENQAFPTSHARVPSSPCFCLPVELFPPPVSLGGPFVCFVLQSSSVDSPGVTITWPHNSTPQK